LVHQRLKMTNRGEIKKQEFACNNRGRPLFFEKWGAQKWGVTRGGGGGQKHAKGRLEANTILSGVLCNNRKKKKNKQKQEGEEKRERGGGWGGHPVEIFYFSKGAEGREATKRKEEKNQIRLTPN